MNKTVVLTTLTLALTSSAYAQDTGTSASEAAEHHAAGEVEPAGVSITVGPVAISRSMEQRLDSDSLTHAPGVYLGGQMRLAIEVADFESSDAKLFIEAEGGYGGTKNSRIAAELNRQPITEWSAFAARATVRRRLSDALELEAGLGAFAQSFIIEPNLSYTGHRYIGAELRAGVEWSAPESSWTLGADASAYPVLSVNQSMGAYGQSSAFGARAGAQIGYDVLSLSSRDGYAGGRLLVRYDFTRFRSQFPEGRISMGGGFSEDDMHAMTLMFGYFM